MKTRYELRDRKIVPCETGGIMVIESPTEEEKGFLRDQFDLDAYDVESMLDPDEIPRMEINHETTFMVIKRPRNFGGERELNLGVGSIGLLLRGNDVIIVVDKVAPPFGQKEFSRIGSRNQIVLQLMLATVHHFTGHLRVIRQMSADLQEKLNSSMENRYFLQMFSLGESLVYYLDAIEGNLTLLSKMRGAAAKIGLTPEEIDDLDDIIIDHQQCAKQARIYSSVQSGLMDARGNIINNNMNVLLRDLTLINVVFLPLNLIASIGGMSEYSSMTQNWDWRVSYSVFSLAMLLIGWGTWKLLLRRMGDQNSSRKS